MTDYCDWVDIMFPGDGLQYPTDEERDRADALVARWSQGWGEQVDVIPRAHPDVTDEGFGNYLAGTPTNRAYLRAWLRRWWLRPGRVAHVDEASQPGAPR